MCKPPKNPLKIQDKDKEFEMSYFEYLAINVKPYLKDYNINLSFKGYKATLDEYENLDYKNIDKVWRLANDLNSWSEYMSDVANLIQKLLLDSETDKIQTIAKVSIESDSKKVASGDRIANQDERVVLVRKKRNTLKAFYTQLENKVAFLERAYHHCKSTCDWQYKVLLQNN